MLILHLVPFELTKQLFQKRIRVWFMDHHDVVMRLNLKVKKIEEQLAGPSINTIYSFALP